MLNEELTRCEYDDLALRRDEDDCSNSQGELCPNENAVVALTASVHVGSYLAHGGDDVDRTIDCDQTGGVCQHASFECGVHGYPVHQRADGLRGRARLEGCTFEGNDDYGLGFWEEEGER